MTTGGIAPFAALSAAYFGFAGLFSTWSPLWYASLGFGTFTIGALVAAQAATRVVAPYAWGAAADASGHRERLLRIATGAALVASLGFLLPPSLAAVGAATVLLYLATAGVIPISETLLSMRVSTAGRLDIGRYGRVRLWGSLGFVGVVAGSGLVLDAAGLGWFPFLCVGVLLVLVATAWGVPKQIEPANAADARGDALAVLRQPLVAWFFAGMFLTVLAHTALYAFFALHLDALGYPKRTIGLLATVGVVAEVVWFAMQGRWLGRLPMHAWLLVAALASALRFGLIAGWASSVAVLVAAQLLHALTFAAQHSACTSLLTRHFPGRLRARGQALYAVIGYGTSGVLGGLAGGALGQAFGYASVFWAASGVALVAAAACGRAVVLDRRASG